MNRLLRHSLPKALHALLILALLFALTACTTGDNGELVIDPNIPVPTIFGLTKDAVNVGDTLQITGRNFGEQQGNGIVRLGNMTFQVNSWTDTLIDVTVVPGMGSGIVSITKDGKTSVSGQEAQLIIGQLSDKAPVIHIVTPSFGRVGQAEVSIVGNGFGTLNASSGVFFTAAFDFGAEFVQAEVLENEVTGQPQWTATNIRVRVPAETRLGTHELYVVTGHGTSNTMTFEALPPQGTAGDPLITDITPMSGPIGQQVTITGANFGVSQGASVVTISPPDTTQARTLLVPSGGWSDNQITAFIPNGAVTGKIRVTVAGKNVEFPTDFIVSRVPTISGVSPSDLRVGQSLTIYGQFFGTEPGTLKIGSTTVQVDSWMPGQLTVLSLPPINTTDPDTVPVVVTNTAQLSSLPFLAKLTSDLFGVLTVNPKLGVADLTEFTFSFAATGGSDNYKFELIPDRNNPSNVLSVTGNTKKHKYPVEGNYIAQGRITDNATGDLLIVNAPEVTVRGADDVVVLSMAPLHFGRYDIFAEPILAENEQTAVNVGGELQMSDFVFPSGLTPHLNNVIVEVTEIGGGPVLPAFVRNQTGFLAGGTLARPYGYRATAAGPQDGIVRITGANFGDSGELWLKSNQVGFGTQVDPASILLWSPDTIEFRVPHGHLSGTVAILNTSVTPNASGVSDIPLLLNPQILTLSADVPSDGQLFITGNDLSGPALGIDGIAGTQTYLFFVGPCSYNDPFDSGNPAVKQALVMKAFPVSVLNGTQITFNMANLMSGGQVKLQVADTGGQNYDEAMGTPQSGGWQVFVWSSALVQGPTVSPGMAANSGIMSRLAAFNVGGGGGGNQPPVITAFTATPDEPLLGEAVNFAATASDPDGAIVSYEWDFDGDGTFDQNTGTTASVSYPGYTVPGNYDAVVRVTDDGTPAESDTETVQVRVQGPPGP